MYIYIYTYLYICIYIYIHIYHTHHITCNVVFLNVGWTTGARAIWAPFRIPDPPHGACAGAQQAGKRQQNGRKMVEICGFPRKLRICVNFFWGNEP